MNKLPLNVLSLGFGVQSSTLALMAEHGEIEPPLDAGIFADTKAEPQSVYQWAKYMKSKVKRFKILIVSKGSLTKVALTMRRTKSGFKYSKTDKPFLARGADGSQGKIRQRGCTRDFKIHPIIRKCRQMLPPGAMKAWRAKHKAALAQLTKWKREDLAWRKKQKANKDGLIISADPAPKYPHEAWMECQRDPLVIQWIGISLDEVTRMKESRDPWIQNRWPLVEKGMRRHDCVLWMNRNGYPKPPRSACYYCPFHNDFEWLRMKKEEPKEFNKAVRFDRAIRRVKADSENMRSIPFLHRSLLPLDKIDFSTQDEKTGQGNLFENECEGMCGV